MLTLAALLFALPALALHASGTRVGAGRIFS